MEKVVLEVPGLWADHHVLALRDALVSLSGVEDVYASSAWKQVLVSYDPSKIDSAALGKALADAGYPVDGDGPTELVQPNAVGRDPRWEELGGRVTKTNQADNELSGEFRRY